MPVLNSGFQAPDQSWAEPASKRAKLFRTVALLHDATAFLRDPHRTATFRTAAAFRRFSKDARPSLKALRLLKMNSAG